MIVVETTAEVDQAAVAAPEGVAQAVAAAAAAAPILCDIGAGRGSGSGSGGGDGRSSDSGSGSGSGRRSGGSRSSGGSDGKLAILATHTTRYQAHHPTTLHQAHHPTTPPQSYEAGGYFGELAMMYNCPRAATVKCAKGGMLWGLSREVYAKVMATTTVAMDSKSQFLRSVEILSQVHRDTHAHARMCAHTHGRKLPRTIRVSQPTAYNHQPSALSPQPHHTPSHPNPKPNPQLSEAERHELSEMLEEATYADGAKLWTAGDPADSLILIKSGQVEVFEPKVEGSVSVRLGDGTKLNVGDFFGTQSLTDLQGIPAKASNAPLECTT